MHNKKLRKKFDLEHSSCKPSQIREVQPCVTISSFVNSIQRSVNITIKKGTQTGYWWELNMKKQLDIWKRLMVELHAGVLILNKEVAVEPKLAIYDVKNEAPPLHASTSLDKKLSPRIVILKAVCRLIVLLLNTVCSFSIFAAGFSFTFSNFAQYCVVLFNALRCDRDKK